MAEDTVLVTLCDAAYWPKAEQTILDIRLTGGWTGALVLIAVDFVPPPDFCRDHSVEIARFPRIPTAALIAAYRARPLSIPTHDNRQFDKVTQWEKFHVFDLWFSRWARVIYFDAGLRLLDSITPFLDLDWRGKFLALNDTGGNPNKTFGAQLELNNNTEAIVALLQKFGPDILERPYFLNCMWIYDTDAVFELTSKEEMIATMDAYPIWRTNEMGVMNVLLHFKYKLWSAFPWKAPDGRYLFDWSEANHPGTIWRDYYALKYPSTGPPAAAAALRKTYRVGLAIPCYKRHIPQLISLLDSLEQQTLKPDAVVVSCSSTPAEDFPILKRYSFPLQVMVHAARKSAAQNRNLAIKALTQKAMSVMPDLDYISFFDADDVMHPDRLRAIIDTCKAQKTDIILHNFVEPTTEKNTYAIHDLYPNSNWTVKRGLLARGPTGCAILKGDAGAKIHHSQVTVARAVLDRVKFREDVECERREDALFCGDVLALPGIRTAYIAEPLSIYFMEGAWYSDVPNLSTS